MAISYGRSFIQAGALRNQSLNPARSRRMVELLDQATAEKDALLAITILCDYLNRWNEAGPDEVERARSAVNEALAIDPAFFLAHYARGFLYRADGQHDQELAAFDETIKANPEFARAHAQRGEALLYLGRAPEAIVAVDEAITRSPASNIIGYFYWVKGRSYFYQEQYDEAIEWLERSVRNWSRVWYNRAYLISAHALSGKPGSRIAFRRVYRAFDKQFPGYTVTRVIDNERATPDNTPAFIAMRERFHEGLRIAGMPP
jgi:adenylate cyclase